MFDIKQFLCHLMGIASNKDRHRKAKLVYLFFKPKVISVEENKEIERAFEELKKETEIIFGSALI